MTSGIRSDAPTTQTQKATVIPYRRILSTVLLAGAVAVLLWGYITGTRLAPQTVEYTYRDSAYFNVSVDRRYVWQSGDCVILRWESGGLQTIWLDNDPTVGVAEREWCVNGRFSVPYWEITYTDGETRRYIPFALHTRRLPALLYALPLLLLGVYGLGFLEPLRRGLGRLPLTLRAPFTVGDTVHLGLVGLYIAINSLVAFNVFYHNPIRSYDAHGHYRFVATLAEGRLPTRADTVEFYSPPLPYVIPTLVTLIQNNDCNDPMQTCNFVVHKAGQIQNLAVSLVLTFFFLRVVRWFDRYDGRLRLLALLMLASVPAYYKTLSYMRGEPFITAIMVVLLDRLLVMLSPDRPTRWTDALQLGIPMGLMMLSRQWAAPLLIAVAIWALVVIVRQWHSGKPLLWVGIGAFAVAFVISSWFFFNLMFQQGSVIAASRDRLSGEEVGNLQFDLPTETLFTTPYRYQYGLQVLPIFYTEMWGDYFAFFQFDASIIRSLNLMPQPLLDYVTRVNVVSLLPTALFMVGGGVGIAFIAKFAFQTPHDVTTGYALLGLCVITTLISYRWFLSSYNSFNGDMAKATYMLQLLPLLAILSSRALLALKAIQGWAYWTVVVLFTAVAVHNLPAMVTRLTQYG